MPSGPELELLTRRLAECPLEFTRPPGTGAGEVDVEAVVNDLLRDLGLELGSAGAPFFSARALTQSAQRLALVASWLLHDDWFLSHPGLAEPVRVFLSQDLGELAELVRVERFLHDPDRREELVRLALHALGLVPAGETETAAQDRLGTLSTLERKRVLDATRSAREHAEKVRAALREKAAAESAARYTRE